MTPLFFLNILQAAGAENTGWIFCNFNHRDRLTDKILHIDPDRHNSRLWVFCVGRDGRATKIVHRIEPSILDALPGDTLVYDNHAGLLKALAGLGGGEWAALLSENISALSTLDAGTALLFRQAGLTLTPADSLVQRVCGLLDSAGIASHERAASAVYRIVKRCWTAVNRAFTERTAISEGDIRKQMLSEMSKLGLETEGRPIVAAGAHTALAHYEFDGDGAAFQRGDVIQFDLWAREKDAVWADISWAGVFDTQPSPAVSAAWNALVDAREAVVACIDTRLAAGERPTGAMLDDLARRRLQAAGYGAAIAHRTGHAIDTACHGSGVNLDAHEFPDGRRLLDGSCFSIEPGLYFEREKPAFGLRTEINMWVFAGKGTVSGGERQRRLLTCGGGIV